MTERRIINTDKAPKAIGPYSQAMHVGNTLYISGQLGMNPATGKLVEGGTAEQTRQAFSQCFFDRTRCADGLKALRNYQYTWDEQYSVFRERPLHNWASNYADAFRQFGTGFKPTTGAFDTSNWNPGGGVR